MRTALPDLPRCWLSIDLPGYRDHPSRFATYSAFEYDGLPPIERDLDDDLRWLRNEVPVEGSLADRAPGDPGPRPRLTIEYLDQLLDPGRRDRPKAFEVFVASVEARSRIRSATACYADLGEFAVPVLGGGWLIHFLSDQQWALHWLLYLGRAGSEAVVVTDAPLGFAADRDPPGAMHEFDPASGAACVCAESFSEFLFRFWIENEIWFALADPSGARRQLTSDQVRYLAHYRA